MSVYLQALIAFVCPTIIIARYIHKWRQSNCSFPFRLIILTSLVSTYKIQKNFCFKVRLVRMINTKTIG